MRTGRPAENLEGRRFGRLTITTRVASRGGGARWIALCDCGGTTEADASDYKRGGVNSCGCLRVQLAKSRSTHGESQPRTKEYAIWCSMRQRCLDQNHKDYHRYGGRGVTVSDEFMSYESFLEAMGRCPEGMSLERIDNGGPYSRTNCKWASATEQGSNKRNNKLVSAFGETKVLSEWSRDPRCVVTYKTLKSRIGRQGWPAELAILTPPQPRNWMKGLKQNHFKERCNVGS